MPSNAMEPDALKEHIPGLDSIGPAFAVGGFKSVYLAVVKGKKEALKVLRIKSLVDPGADPDLADAFQQEQIARVRREVESLRKCQIPEMVKLGGIAPIEFDIAGEKHFAYSEEFLEGQDLGKIINLHGPLPALAELVQLFRSLLKCIRELWRHGLVHRDIKPLNVMKTPDPARPFVLLDLGIAYAVHETSLTAKPEDRLPLATFRYLAPEMMQLDFRDRLDFRADLYTTGMTLFEYAAGQHPLAKSSDDMMRTISRALRQQPTPLKKHRPDLPDSFCSLVDGLLKKKPALRPANLEMLFQKLKEIA
jgi:serine/threonine protein kinase